jgi:hypothetical protein
MAGVGVSNLEQLMAIEWKFVAAREDEQSLFISRLFPAKKNHLWMHPVKKPFMDAPPVQKKPLMDAHPVQKKPFMDAHPVQKKPFMDAHPVQKNHLWMRARSKKKYKCAPGAKNFSCTRWWAWMSLDLSSFT